MLKLRRLEQTCGACPSQWEGEFEDGSPVYIRYRHGHLYVADAPRGTILFAANVEYGGGGTMTTEEMLAVTGLEWGGNDGQEMVVE